MKNLGLFFLLFLAVLQVGAQEYTVSVQQYTTDDGLASPVVNEVAKDDRGFIWIATSYGIDRFDGRKFKPYFRDKLTSAKGIIRAPDGKLWVLEPTGGLSDHRLWVIDAEYEEIYEAQDVYEGLKDFDPTGISLWMATDDALYLGGFRPSMLEFKNREFSWNDVEGLAYHAPVTWSKDHGVFSYFFAAEGDIPRGTLRQTIAGKTKEIERLHLGNVIQRGCIGLSPDGNLVYSAGRHPGRTLDDHIVEYTDSGMVLLEHRVSDILGRNVGQFSDLVFKHNVHNSESWLFYEDSLYIFDQQFHVKFRGVISKDEAFSAKHNSVFFEDENVAWVCGQRGLVRIATSVMRFSQHFTREQTGPLNRWGSNACRQIYETDSIIVLATDNGITRLRNDGTFEYISGEDGISLGFHVNGTKLFYSQNMQLFEEDLVSRKSRLFSQKGDEFPHVPWMISELNDSLFIVGGNFFTLVSKDSGKEVVWQSLNEISSLGISFYQIVDFGGKKYLASDGGLFELNPQTRAVDQRLHKETDPIALKHVHSIQPTENGLWLSTANTGLVFWNPQLDTIQQFLRKDGLPSNVVYAALVDERGFIWLSTDNGLSRFDPSNRNFRNYGVDEGLSEFEFNRNSYHIGKSGKFYFGTVDGFNVFDPADYWDDSNKDDIPLEVIGVEQDLNDSNKVVDVYKDFLRDSKLTLGPYDKFLTVDYHLLNYQQFRYSFAYKIEGYDVDWTYTDDNSMRVGGLPGGDYILRIRGQLEDGTWSRNEISIPLTVHVPYYEEPWFITAVLMLIVILAMASIKWRTARLKQRTLELESTVASRTSELDRSLKEKEVLLKEIHHRVKNNLQVISSLLDLQSNRITDEGTKDAFLEGQNRVRSIALIHQQLYQNDDLAGIEIKEFSENLFEQIRSAMHQKGMDVKFAYQGEKTMFDIDTAVPIGLILNELITNSFKYAVEGRDEMVFRMELVEEGNGRYLLNYSDGGPGIPESVDIKKVRSLGLRLIHRLSRQLGGSAKIGQGNQALFAIQFLNTKARSEME